MAQWIKASERLPADPAAVHWRDEVTKLPIPAKMAYRYAVSENDSDAVEWLDESPDDKDREIEQLKSAYLIELEANQNCRREIERLKAQLDYSVTKAFLDGQDSVGRAY